MKKQRKQRPKVRSRAGASPSRARQSRALAQKKRLLSYAYAVYGKAPSRFDGLKSSLDRLTALARDGVEAVEARAERVRTFAFDDVPTRVRPHVSRVRSAAVAASHSYSTDDRELAGFLILPFLILATAMVISQSARRWENFDAPAAYEGRFESGRLARARAIAAHPMIALRPLSAAPVDASSPVARDLELVPIDRVAAARAHDVPVERTLPTETGRLGPEARSLAASQVLQPAPSRGQELAMLAPGQDVLPERGPERALTEPRSPELPALDDDGRFESGTHMCFAEPRRQKPVAMTPRPEVFGRLLAEAAREQTEDFVIYADAYRTIAYPGGDVPQIFGVCTDVVVRAYRALGIDLQRDVHEAKVGSGDVNIDHRRVEVLRRFFAKMGELLPITDVAEDYQPGDIVSYYRPQNQHTRSHIAIVSSVVAPSGRLMIIHNRGWGPQLEDGLFVDQITGHFRYRGRQAAPVLADPLAKGQRSSEVTPASLVSPAPLRKSVRGKLAGAQ